SCALRGAADVFEAAYEATGIDPGEETSADGAFTIHEEECLGACDAAPVVQIDFANHDRVTPARMGALVESLRSREIPEPSRRAARPGGTSATPGGSWRGRPGTGGASAPARAVALRPRARRIGRDRGLDAEDRHRRLGQPRRVRDRWVPGGRRLRGAQVRPRD